MNNSFNKVLISTVAALFATQAEASGMHNSCLSLTNETAGHSSGHQFFTNEGQLTTSAVTESMHL